MSAAERWYQTPEVGALYAVYDAARSIEVLPGLEATGERYVSLFQERSPSQLDQAAPLLAMLTPDGALARRTLDQGWASRWSIFLRASVHLDLVRQQLRRLLTAQLPSGQKVLFRFYDPRILRLYLPTCTPEELAQFFGPLHAFYAFHDDAPLVYVFTRDEAGALSVQTRPAEP